MKRTIEMILMTLLIVLAAVFVGSTLMGCSSDSDDPMDNQKEIELKNFSNTGCKNRYMSRAEDDNNASFEDSVLHDGYLDIYHRNVMFNCCPGTIGADIQVEGNKIIIGEYETEDMCDCVCPYDLGYEVGPLVEGKTYTIYIGRKGRELKVAEFTFQNSMSGTWEEGSYESSIEYEENPTTLIGTWHLVKANYAWEGIREYVGKSTLMSISYDNYLFVDHIEGEEKTFLYGGIYDYTLSTDDADQVITIKASDIENYYDLFQGPDEFRDIEYKFTYRIQDGMLFFDGGVAHDGPGYYFKKVIANNRPD